MRAICKGIAPAGEVRQPGLVQPAQNDILSERQAEVIRGFVQATPLDAMWKKAIAVIRHWGIVTPRRDRLMPRYPNVFVQVSDGKPISEIIERAETAMERAGISSAKRREFRDGIPGQYALAVDYIREFCETD